MADNVTFGSGNNSTPPNATVVATDDAGAGGHVQIVKLAQSANGSATPVTADADGILVNLGANNDVTITGVATAANQATELAHLAAIEAAVEGTLAVSGTVTVNEPVSVDDNGGSLTVDGTVAATQSGAWNVTNVSGTVSLPTGAATLAEQQSQTTHLSNAATSLGTLDNAIAGSEMQVDVVAALPAGNNNIGDVDVASSALPTGASTSANQTTIIGHLDGVEGLLTTIDGDTGNLNDTVAVLGTATYTEGTTKGQIVGAVRRDADTTLVNTTNEVGPLQMDANGRLKVEAFSGETLPVSLASTTITGTVAVTQSGTWDEIGINDSGNSITVDGTVTANLAAGTNNIGDVDVLSTVLPVPASTAAVTSVADAATSATLLSSSATRKGFRLYNDSTENLYVKYGTTASSTDFTVLMRPGAYLEENHYYGRVDGIWANNASGSARITELT